VAGFYRELEKKDFNSQLLSKKERLTALKFYNRMSFRATPFGAFAAFGLATWGEPAKKGTWKNLTMRLHLLPSVEKELEPMKVTGVAEGGLLAINPTLYRLASGWRYTRYETEKKQEAFFLFLQAGI
jgi:hypothetical protein